VTADEWESSTDLDKLLAASGLAAGSRQLLLFGAACARRVAAQMPDDAARGLIDLAERYAEGLSDEFEWFAACLDVEERVVAEIRACGPITQREWHAAVAETLNPYLGNEAARDGAGGATFGVLMNLYRVDVEHTRRLVGAVIEARAYLAYTGGHPPDVEPEERVRRAAESEVKALCGLLRCIAGNPLRSTSFDPQWRTSTAVALAAGIYRRKAFHRLPILADALQDAGCYDEHLLNHCRGAGDHARGCHVIDAVLGRG
jgi:hypothetical protein